MVIIVVVVHCVVVVIIPECIMLVIESLGTVDIEEAIISVAPATLVTDVTVPGMVVVDIPAYESSVMLGAEVAAEESIAPDADGAIDEEEPPLRAAPQKFCPKIRAAANLNQYRLGLLNLSYAGSSITHLAHPARCKSE